MSATPQLLAITPTVLLARTGKGLRQLVRAAVARPMGEFIRRRPS